MTFDSFPAQAAALPGASGPTYGSALWALPFLALLLSLAAGPIATPRFWHRRMGAVAFAWSLALLVPLAILQAPGTALAEALHALLVEYMPFMTLLLALYTVCAGILIQGGPGGRPLGNTLLLAIGTAAAGVMGTTGASMVLIQPLLRANAHRRRRFHLVLFFTLLVSNAGGATTPLGDPPLYIGFLHGVPFFWPITHLAAPLLVLAAALLVVFYVTDRWLCASEPQPPPGQKLILRGGANAMLLAVLVANVLAQAHFDSGSVTLLGQEIGTARLGGSVLCIIVTLISARITPPSIHHRNLFSWEPIAEVAKLFAAIFVTAGPVLTMLAEGPDGPLGTFLRISTDQTGQPIPMAYFWLTGALAAFLDNAPTYLVFFQQAGGNPALLTGPDATVLQAITAGAVFFGGLTYIGNAPNIIVRAIASRRGVPMPGFVAYMAIASSVLLPILALVAWLFFA